MKNHLKKSFTLVEVLVATAIMVLIIGAASSAEAMYIRSGDAVAHTLQANNLAEEGMNLVKVVRDKNLLASPSTDPLVSFPNNSDPQASYKFDVPSDPANFTLGSEAITLDGTGTGITFTREIYFDNKPTIRVNVAWQEHGLPKSVEYVTILSSLSNP